MLRYGNPVSNEKKLINIDQVIQDIILISNAECKKRKISIKLTLQKIPQIYGDAHSLHQALLNILLNSIQAINTNGNIHIKIR